MPRRAPRLELSGHGRRTVARRLPVPDTPRYASVVSANDEKRSPPDPTPSRRRGAAAAMAGCCSCRAARRPSAGRRVLVGAAALAALALRRSTDGGLRSPPRRRPISTPCDAHSTAPAPTAGWPPMRAAAARGSAAGRADRDRRRTRRARPGAVRRDHPDDRHAAADDHQRDRHARPPHRRLAGSGPPRPPTTSIAALRAVRRQRRAGRRGAVRLPRRAARLDRRGVHGGYTVALTRRQACDDLTDPSPDPRPDAARSDAADGALFDAVATEHGTIYGYGIVSAHSDARGQRPGVRGHGRAPDQREEAIAMLEERGVDAAAARGRLPAADGGRHSRPTPPTSPCGWRRTPPSRGGPCSSRRPISEDRALRASPR